jgi:hypothetical protein
MTRGTTTGATRRLVAGVVATLALAAMLGTAGAEPTPGAAARLVERMRAAAAGTDFVGTVEVGWRAQSGAVERATVDVRSVGGVIEAASGGHVALDDGVHTFFKDELGWSSAVSTPTAGDRPAPDAAWDLRVRRTRYQDRPATTVVASHADGAVAQRLVIDDETHLPLSREVLAPDGRVERFFRFVAIDVADVPAPAAITTPRITARGGTAVAEVPDGYRAPASAGAGYVLVSRARTTDGVQLVYSDGLFSVSVREQLGELDWGVMPEGGTDAEVDGARALRYREPMGDVLVWEHDGVVFTCVSDAPNDVLTTMVQGLTPSRSLGRRVVDFVLGPIGFE